MALKGVQVYDGDGDQPVQHGDLKHQVELRRYVEGHYPGALVDALVGSLKSAPSDVLGNAILSLTKITPPDQRGTPEEQERRCAIARMSLFRRYPERFFFFIGIVAGLCTASAAIMAYNQRPASVLLVLAAWSGVSIVVGGITWMAKSA